MIKSSAFDENIFTVSHNCVFYLDFCESNLQDMSNMNFSGNVLTIYENSDPYGVSAIERKINA
ncbi:hypothetical protein [Empedobacter brevis]|uniref:hypothetical protein n=1 Tax=Empedobacter brevis TaxID=247 RepID=UPI002FE0DB9F